MSKILQESQVRKSFKFSMNKDINVFWRVDAIVDKTERYNIDFDVWLPTRGMNLQRPLVWTLHQKQQLILSILKGIPLPKMCIIQHKDESRDLNNATYQIIDGKQRLSTILDFLRGEFAIEVEGECYFYNDLDKRLKSDIGGYSPRCDLAYSYHDTPISDDDKIAWFEQINFTGTPQDVEHLNRIKSKKP